MSSTTRAMALRALRVSEKDVQYEIVTLLRSIGAAVYVLGTKRARGDVQGTRQTPGISDLYCLLPAPRLSSGHACGVWIEVKAEGGQLRPEQHEFRRHCIAAGVPHVVGGTNEVVEFLSDGGWLKGVKRSVTA